MRFRCRHLVVFGVLLSLVVACTGLTAPPAAAPRTYRIGYFGSGGDPRPSPFGKAFVDELARLGYVADQNLTIEYRWSDGQSERLPGFAQELSALKLDAIFASSEASAQAMIEADPTVPVVMST
ncbi:MAG: hypothetical protein U0893_23400 [Chloroflexota bacterium]